MFKHKLINLLMVLSVILALPTSTFAQSPGKSFTATPLSPDGTISVQINKEGLQAPRLPNSAAPGARGMVSVIVKLDQSPLATYRGGIDQLAPTDPKVTGADHLDTESKDSRAYLGYLARQQDAFEAAAKSVIPQANITHRYDVILDGLSMLVPADQVGSLSTLKGVVAVYPDELRKTDTDNSPQFIGAPAVWNQLGGQESSGEGVVIGVLDTGIWPEHPSFSDPDPSGKPYAPLASWHGTACDFGKPGSTLGDAPFTCNNKLVGAARFMATYEAVIGLLPEEYRSARDDDGHGTHTSSTSGGNAGVQASIFGIPRGTISGIAPRARIAMYKVCGAQGCFQSDSAAAVEQAIQDGVNVINFSISGGNNPYSDAVELAFLDAYAAGVFVAASAGNSGPGADTVNHRGPWVTTVAASTQNRAFVNTVNVTADGGASLTLSGVSLTGGIGPMPLVVAGDAPYNDPLCLNSTADGAFAGKIVVCKRGVAGRAEKGYNVQQRGAVGMILYNQALNVTDLETDNHFIPASHIQFTDGQALLDFNASHTNVQATLTQGVKAPAQGDVMASFSSRGGPGQSLGVSKPDVTAPGVQILAGASAQHLTPDQGGVALGPEGELFQAIAGTSMSSPHVAGSAALLKALHLSWTPGQIKSALMTTASQNVVKEDGVTPANAFDDGSGRIDLNYAGNAMLTFDETAADYAALRDQLWNANYPSLYVPLLPGSITVSRTVHNEDNKMRSWTTDVAAPADVSVTLPKNFSIAKNGNLTLQITVSAPTVPLGEVRFAMITFTSSKDTIHFPITIVRNQPVVSLDKTCTPASITLGASTACTIKAVNNSFRDANVLITDKMPDGLSLDISSVTGATAKANRLSFAGTLAGAQPPDVAIGPGASPAGGYLPLSLFGIPPVSGVDDDTITNFNVPAFLYGGQTYSRLGFASNGYVVVGGGTGADISINNQYFPNATPPNNVLAPFWTDLNPGATGAMRIGSLTDGTNSWIVLDWDAVGEFSTGRMDSFEVWIQTGGTEGISYAYGPIGGNGDGGFLSVGAENIFGNRGANAYYNGTGSLPFNGTQLVVTTTPPTAGGSQVITFNAVGAKVGTWQNCANLTADLFQGTNISCFNEVVTR